MAAYLRDVNGIAALPEDVVHEVLHRVGNVKDLFMLAVTCRRWLRRFTDPAFLRGLCGVKQGARLLGFFFQQTRHERCTFLPAPGSPIRDFTSLGALNYGEPLAARGGIVLMRLVPCTLGTQLFGLCNPITGERHLLPPLKCAGYVLSYAIVTAADSDLPSSISPGRDSYSAATGSWSAPTVCPTQKLARFSPMGVSERPAVVHQGAAHWLWIDQVDGMLYKLSTEVGKHKHPCCDVSMTKLLQIRAGGTPVLCVSRDGKLAIACVYLQHVTLWTQQQQQQGGDEEWLRTAVIRIPTAATNPNYSNPRAREVWFDFSRGSLLVLHRSSGVFILDLDHKVMENIMDDRLLLPRFSHYQTQFVAYEMDLVDFFLRQLPRPLTQ